MKYILFILLIVFISCKKEDSCKEETIRIGQYTKYTADKPGELWLTNKCDDIVILSLNGNNSNMIKNVKISINKGDNYEIVTNSYVAIIDFKNICE